MAKPIAKYLPINEIPPDVIGNEGCRTAIFNLVHIRILVCADCIDKVNLEGGICPWCGAVHPPNSIQSLNLLRFSQQEVNWYKSAVAVHNHAF